MNKQYEFDEIIFSKGKYSMDKGYFYLNQHVFLNKSDLNSNIEQQTNSQSSIQRKYTKKLLSKLKNERTSSYYNVDTQAINTEEGLLAQERLKQNIENFLEKDQSKSQTNQDNVMQNQIVYDREKQINLSKCPQSDKEEQPQMAQNFRKASKNISKIQQHYFDQILRIQQLKSTVKQKNNQNGLKINFGKFSQKNVFNSQFTLIDDKSIQSFRKTIQGKGQLNQDSNQITPLIHKKEKSQFDNRQKGQNWKILNKLGIAIRIKQKLLSLIQQKIENVSSFQHYLIGDYSDSLNKNPFEEETLITSKFNNIFFLILNPGSILVIWSKIFLSSLTLLNLILLPVIFGFDLEITNNIIITLTVSAFFYILEILMKFKIAYYEMGEPATDQIKIFKRYFANDFLFDVITCISLIIGLSSKYILIITLLKARNLRQYLWDIDNHYFLSERFHAAWALIKLFCFISVMAHYFACLFHYVSLIQIGNPNVVTWIDFYNLLDSSWSLRYNYSLYFSFITCITIGYGDITPKNTLERNVVILISLVSAICFSYSVNTIGTIFQQYFKKIKNSKKAINQFNYLLFKREMRFDAINFMRERQIHKTLQLRILKYIEYINQMRLQSPDKGLNVVNQISSHLKSQLFQDFYGKILKQNKNLSLNFSNDSLDKLSLKMKEKIFGPGEIIFEQQEQDFKIFYLMKGEVEFYFHKKDNNKQNENISISSIDKSMFFGYKEFIYGIPREMTCRSVNVSHVFYCSREDLVSILKEDPEDYEQFCKIRDEYLLYTQTQGEQCSSCKQFGHAMSACHKIHLIKNKQLLIQKFNYSETQNRNYYSRKQLKYQSLLNQQLTSFDGMKRKLKTIMNLRQENISDEIVEQIIVQDLTSDKQFQLQFPSVNQFNPTIKTLIYYLSIQIQYRDKEILLNDEDDDQDSNFNLDDSKDSQNNYTTYSGQDKKNSRLTKTNFQNKDIHFSTINKFKTFSKLKNNYSSFASSESSLSSFSSSSSYSSSSSSSSSNGQLDDDQNQKQNQQIYNSSKNRISINQNEKFKISNTKNEKKKFNSKNLQFSLIEFEQKYLNKLPSQRSKQLSKQTLNSLQKINSSKSQEYKQNSKNSVKKENIRIINQFSESNLNDNVKYIIDNANSSNQCEKLNVAHPILSKKCNLHSTKNNQNLNHQKVIPLNGIINVSQANKKVYLAPIIDLVTKKRKIQTEINKSQNSQMLPSIIQPSYNEIQIINNKSGQINQFQKPEQNQQARYSSLSGVLQSQNNQNQIEGNTEYDLGIIDFDSLKEFSRYFPHNNISVVCFNFKQFINKKNLIKKCVLNRTQEIIYNIKCKSISGLHSLLIQQRKNKKLQQLQQEQK